MSKPTKEQIQHERNKADKYRTQDNLDWQMLCSTDCPICGDPLLEVLEDSDIELAHIKALSKGGKSTPGNMVFIHQPCNREASDNNLRSITDDVKCAIDKLIPFLKLFKEES